MVNHSGTLLDDPQVITVNRDRAQNFFRSETVIDYSVIIAFDLFDTGIDDQVDPSPNTGNVAGVILADDGIDNILNKFYVNPVDIDAGFIVEEQSVPITLWSSYRYPITVTGIDKFNVAGLVIQHDTLPFGINANAETINDLTILKTGPPTQNSRLTYHIDQVSGGFEVNIIGQRITAFVFEPDFTSIEMAYLLESTKYEDNKGNEQRRCIGGPWARREMAFDMWDHRVNAQKMRNAIYSFRDTVMGVPMFTEPMHLFSDPQLQTVLEIEEDFTYYFNLIKNTDFLLIKDLVSGTHEIKQIAGLDTVNSEITVDIAVTNSYDPKQTIVYPIFLAYLESPQINTPNSDIFKASLRFKEYV